MRMTDEFVEQRNGGYYVRDARVSLDSIVYAYRRGESAESIGQNQHTVDAYLTETEKVVGRICAGASPARRASAKA
jgi:hypothetical protein